MELLAVIRGLETLKRPATVELISDSTYVLKGLAEWMPKWKANGWRRREGDQLEGSQERGPLAEAWTNWWPSTGCGSRMSAATPAIPRTNAATQLAVAAYRKLVNGG